MATKTALLNRKLTIAVLCVSGALSVAVTAAQTLRMWHSGKLKMVSDLDLHVSKIENALATSAWYMDKVHIQSAIEQIGSDMGVIGVELYLEGKENAFAKTGNNVAEGGYNRSWLIRSPQNGRKEVIGTLRVFSSHRDLQDSIWNEAVFLVISNIVKGLLASFIFLFIIEKIVSRHLRDLMQQIYRFDPNNIKPFQRRNVPVRDEFDQLIDALNDMQASIQSARLAQLAASEQLKNSQAESVAFAQQMAVSEVTTSVMHDVNNILSAMNLIVLRAKRDIKTKSAGDVLPSLMTEIDKTTTTVTNIIKAQQTLAAARGDVWDSVTVNQIVQDAVAIEAYVLESRHVELVVTGTVDLRVVTRRFLVMSAVVNCIKNARESIGLFRTEHPTISIDVSTSGDNFSIRVKDNGMGASAETLEKLKIRGFTTKMDGHGFGIFGCRKNMVALGGGLDIESEGIGLGATAVIRQPIDAEKFCAAAPPKSLDEPALTGEQDSESTSNKVISIKRAI